MADWLRLKDIPIEPPVAMPKGVLFNLAVSPYDIPDAVRGFKTPQARFRIEFRYIDGPEPYGAELRLGEHVTGIEGRFTHRLLVLEVDVEAIGDLSVGVSITAPQSQTENLKQRIEAAWDRVAATHLSPGEKSAFASARIALRTREDDLINQLVNT